MKPTESILNTLSQAEIIALTILGEARGERIDGQVAVGCVIRNRLHLHSVKYHSYREVCWENSQFSCWNPNDVNYPKLLEWAKIMIEGPNTTQTMIRQALWIARGIEDWSISDITLGAMNYLTNDLFRSEDKPSWAKDPKKISRIGNHTFFTV